MEPIIFEVDIIPKVKPAGGLTGYGALTQNKGRGANSYSVWKRALTMKIQAATDARFVAPYGLIVSHQIPNRGVGDLANLVGASIDGLVRAEVISDDCLSVIHKFATKAIVGPPKIQYILVFSKSQWTRYLADV